MSERYCDQMVNYEAVKNELRWTVPEVSEKEAGLSEGLPLPCNFKQEGWHSVYVLKLSSRFQQRDRWQKQDRYYEAGVKKVRVSCEMKLGPIHSLHAVLLHLDLTTSPPPLWFIDKQPEIGGEEGIITPVFLCSKTGTDDATTLG
ncbi:MAG: hypothetical protein Q9216_001396 [Gyalolechia sp. 2 TL-2023]